MSEQSTEEEYENPGIEGQIQYPPIEVDAERAGNFAAGKEEFLYPEDGGPADYQPGPNPIFNQELPEE
jgi:hypothetical protein